MSILGNIGDPVKDVAALQPLADELEQKAIDAVNNLFPKLTEALKAAIVGRKITFTITIE